MSLYWLFQKLLINPLSAVPAVTGRAKTHPQFPVLALTGCKKACEDNCLSYPTWRCFGPPIILLLRTNKPKRMDFPSICLEDLRGPRKTVFRFNIMRSKSAGNHGALQDKSTNFQGLVFIPKTEKLDDRCTFKWVLNTDRGFKAAAWT